MMKIKILSLTFLIIFNLQAQKTGTKAEGSVNQQLSKSTTENDPVLITINNKEKISKSEFLNVYMKNNVNSQVIDKKSLDEYLNLYINFKLKVCEAKEMGLDTTKAFITEFKGYRDQLAQPYLTDREVTEELVNEAYDRMKIDIRASHLLIKLAKTASPQDTLDAFKKALSIRERILKGGESFEKIASTESDDPSAKDDTKKGYTGNKGDLGYFTVFDMIYPFENAAYKTPVGGITMPVRTDYGYHLIKVTDKLPAMGKVQVAHLYINVPRNIKNADSLKIYENKIKEAYSKLKDGAKFEDLVKDYSDDKGTASKGGLLPPFGVNRMVPEFIVAIAKLKEKGDISEPVKTMYGWHIIQLVEKKGIGSFDEKKAEIKSKIAKDNRAEKSKESLIARIKKDYKFTENKKAKEDFYKVVTDSVFFGKWKLDQAKGLNSLLFKLGDTSLYQNNFAEYISTHQFFREKQNLETYVNELYKNFIDEVAISYEDKNLENKYPEFKMLVQEYRDGIMLFDITDKKVWSKAVQDTIGLEKYYSNITEKYMWDKRLDASIYSGPNEKVMKQTLSLVKKADKKKYTDNDIYSKINKDKKDNIVIESSLFSKGDNHLIDSIQWAPAITPIFKKGQTYMIIHSRKVLDPQPKTLKEARGLITADYQNYLEQQWISELKRKYPVIINQEVFNTIK